jgi:hypothetical protein
MHPLSFHDSKQDLDPNAKLDPDPNAKQDPHPNNTLECEEGYYCSDPDCENTDHICKVHKTHLRECDESNLGAIEGNCIYCCFEKQLHFDFQYDRDERNDWSMAEIGSQITQLGFKDHLRGFKPIFSTKTPKYNLQKVIDLYNQGVALAKLLESTGGSHTLQDKSLNKGLDKSLDKSLDKGQD